MSLTKDNDKELAWDKEIMQTCPILYTGKSKPLTESLMAFGFESGSGWKGPLYRMSCRLEELNLRYWPKYRVRIEMVQVKEKFGTLCAYYDLHRDGSGFKWWLHNKFYSLYKKANSLNYKPKQILDRDVWTEHELTELTKIEWLKAKHRSSNVSNVRFFEENGRYFKQTSFDHCRQFHYEPTRLKFMVPIKNFLYKLACKTDNWASKANSKQEVIMTVMQEEAEKIVHDAEKECEGTCEDCGERIGTKWSPTCETTGWIRYLCKDCAEKHKNNYFMNGELWNGETRLKTKEELNEERKKAEEKYKERSEKHKEEERKFEEELKRLEAEDKTASHLEHQVDKAVTESSTQT